MSTWKQFLYLYIWSEERKAKYIDDIWDEKTDEQIEDAYESNMGWVNIKTNTGAIGEVKEECRETLNTRILPQMIKRGMREI